MHTYHVILSRYLSFRFGPPLRLSQRPHPEAGHGMVTGRQLGGSSSRGKFCWYAASSPGGKWRSCGDKRPLFGDICVVKNHSVPQQNALLVVKAWQLLDLGTQ